MKIVLAENVNDVLAVALEHPVTPLKTDTVH